MRKQRGYTFIEVAFTMGMIMMVAYGIAEAVRVSSEFTKLTHGKRNRDRVISNLLLNVVENISQYQKNFDGSEDWREKQLALDKLPLAWDQIKLVPVKECPECPGRMGFIIQPMDGAPGLNRLTIRLTHNALLEGPKDYVYVLADD
jgi:hypothetical protein